MSGRTPSPPVVGACTPEVSRPLAAVIERVLENDAPAPSWVAVGGDASWVDHARRATAGSRARAVVLASGDQDLARGVRMGLGGAALLPPSTPAVELAFRAAANGVALPPADLELASEVAADPEGAWRVGWTHRPRWEHAIGRRRIVLGLLRLARVLEAPPVITCGPSLLLAGGSGAGVAAAWAEVASAGLEVPGEPPAIAAAAGGPAVPVIAERPAPPRPVYQLPEGRRIGAWWIEPVPTEGDGWLAVPGGEPGTPWRLLATSSVEEIPEVTSPAALVTAGRPVVRVPGWLSADLRPGSPSAALIARLATEGERLGTVVWVPGVDPDGLAVLLRSGVRLWVDGPAVPT